MFSNLIIFFSEDRCKEMEETISQLREDVASKDLAIEARDDGTELAHIRLQLQNAKNELERMTETNET